MLISYPDTLDDDWDYGAEDVPDFHERLRDLRSRRPAAWVRNLGKPCMMFTSYELVKEAWWDEETFPAASLYTKYVSDVMGHTILCMYGPEHRRNRALASPSFRQRAVAEMISPLLEPVAHELVDRFEDRGSAELVSEFTKRYPFKVICRLLGLPDAAEDQIIVWAVGMIDAMRNHDFAMQCSAEFTEFVAPFLEERRSNPGRDLISSLASAEIDGDRLSDEEILTHVRLLFPAGADTTYLGIGSTILGLLTHPAELERVAANPEMECRWAAEEGLRWEPPVALSHRYNPRCGLEWNSHSRGHAPSLFANAAANRDPEIFRDPDKFDVSRRQTRALTFGLGPHLCLGAPLARAETEIALKVLLERLPRIRLDSDVEDVRIAGAVPPTFRGPNKLPIRYD